MKTLWTSLRLFVALTVLTGMLYPLAVTGIASACFPDRATGQILRRDGRPVGSALLAQRTVDPRFFWPRPSAGDDGTNYVTVPSSASNLGPTSGNLVATVQGRAETFRIAHGLPAGAAVPAEMIFASGSGLDPHISPAAARIQVQRVILARHLTPPGAARLRQRVEAAVEPPQWGFLGEPRVNVLLLNLALDSLR